MTDLGNMTGGEMMGAGAFVFMAFKVLIDSLIKILEKINPNKNTNLKIPDIEDAKWKTNLSGVLDEVRKVMEKMNDKGDLRARILDDVHSLAESDHRRIDEVKDHVSTMAKLMASGSFCSYTKPNK